MPAESDARIQELIVSGVITGFSIDTSILEQYKFGFEVGMLSKLQQFARTDVHFLLPDMVWHEAKQHLIAEAALSQSHFKNALKPLGNDWGLRDDARTKAMKDLFGGKSAQDRTMERLEEFVHITTCELLEAADYVEVDDVVNAYFESLPPFGKKEKKKREFPDSFALLTLEGWANENNTFVLVASKDGDWVSYCKGSERIYVVDDLPRALALFNGGADTALAIFKKWAHDEWADAEDELKQAVAEQIDKIEVIFEGHSSWYFEDHLISTNVEKLSDFEKALNTAEPIDYQNSTLSVELSLSMSLAVEFAVDFMHWDHEEKRYFPLGSTTVDDLLNLNVEVILEIRFEQGTVNVEHIELLPTGITAEIGDLEPDWGEPD